MVTADVLLPYQNKSLADLPGEVWKDIPGFEGTYQASTMGRIKSLDRTIQHPRLYQQFVKGQILSQSVAKNNNIKTGKPMIDLRVTFAVEHTQYYFNTRRIIYKTFIDPRLDYGKDGLHVINVDGDGYNNRLENLALDTKSEKPLQGATGYCRTLKRLIVPTGKRITPKANRWRNMTWKEI